MEVSPAGVEVADEGDCAGGVESTGLSGPGGDGRRQQVVVVLLRERRARAPPARDGRSEVRLLRAASTASGSRRVRGRAGRRGDADGVAVDAGGAGDDVVGDGRDGAVCAGGVGETGRGRGRGRVVSLLHAAV